LDNYQNNQKLHAQINESGNFLLQISDPSTCNKIKERLVAINKRWKQYQDRFKDTEYEELLKYYECEHSLNMVKERLVKVENLINKVVKSNLNALNKHQEESQKAFNDIDCLDANLKLLQKLSERLDGKQIEISEFFAELKATDIKLSTLRPYFPEILRNITKISQQIATIESELPQVEQWLNEAETMLKLDPDQYNFEQLIKHTEKQRVEIFKYYFN
jgi:hypothetical protein